MPTVVNAEAPGDERGALLDYLEAQRGGLRRALLGLSDEQAAERPTVSALSLGGLVKHAAQCEEGWVRMARQQPPAVPRDASNWDSSFRLEDGESLAGMLEYWDGVARATEEYVRELPDLDVAFPLPPAPWFPADSKRSVRWMLLHLIEEFARHAGHADVIRETIDGRTAFELVGEAGA